MAEEGAPENHLPSEPEATPKSESPPTTPPAADPPQAEPTPPAAAASPPQQKAPVDPTPSTSGRSPPTPAAAANPPQRKAPVDPAPSMSGRSPPTPAATPDGPQDRKAREFIDQAEGKIRSSQSFFGGLFGYVLGVGGRGRGGACTFTTCTH